MKRSPLRRKQSLQRAYARKQAKRGLSYQKAEKAAFLRKKPLKKVSASQRKRLARYFAIRNAWLKEPRNAVCAICLLRDQKPQAATEVHHARGRAGSLLCDTRFWVTSCRGCREFPHEHPTLAREWGILAQPWEWNVPPKESAFSR